MPPGQAIGVIRIVNVVTLALARRSIEFVERSRCAVAGSDPKNLVAVLKYGGDKGRRQAIWVIRVARIMGKDFGVLVKPIQTTSICTDPENARLIFKYGPHLILTQAVGIIGPGTIGIEPLTLLYIGINSSPISADPQHTGIVFDNCMDPVIT